MTNPGRSTKGAANTAAPLQRITATEFEQAWAEYERALTAYTAKGPSKEGDPNPAERFGEALNRLMRTPAPNLDALRRKMEATKGEPAWALGMEAQNCIDLLIADARRLQSKVPATVAEPSIIFTLHARFEEVWQEYYTIEAAKIAARVEPASSRDAHAREFRLDEAARRSGDEEVALNIAILHQVPSTWQEALILAAHLKIIGIEEGGERTGAERQAAETGFDTLLDFLFGQIDHEKLECAGEQLSNIARIVYERRRLRTGHVEAA